MNKTKIAITLEAASVKRLDHLIRENVFSNRSQAIQQAVKEKLARIKHSRLAKECSKLDPSFEKAMADVILNEVKNPYPLTGATDSSSLRSSALSPAQGSYDANAICEAPH